MSEVRWSGGHSLAGRGEWVKGGNGRWKVGGGETGCRGGERPRGEEARVRWVGRSVEMGSIGWILWEGELGVLRRDARIGC